jgi:hypothetical protein
VFTMLDKAKVKLSLCLSKYHAMNMYPLFNQAPCHEDMGGMEV